MNPAENKTTLKIQYNYLQFYRNKISQHESYALGFLISGILLALSGVAISFFIYNIKITKLEDYKNKLENEISSIDDKLGGSDYEYFEIQNLEKLITLIKEKKAALKKYDKYEKLESLTNDSAFKEKLFYPEGKVKIETLIVKNKYDQVSKEINDKEKILSENSNHNDGENIIAKNKKEKLEKEIWALKTELDLLEFLQLKINNSNLDERKESDKKNIKKYLIEINYTTFLEMQEDYSNKYKEKELEELQLKKKLILLEQKKKTIEKSISELENHIIDLERQPLSQGEIVSISFQFLYKIAFILTIELIAFFLLRQYRLSLDEARYFSNLLKDNENNMILLEMLNHEKDKKIREKVYNDLNLQKANSKLQSGESTEFLEIKKLSKDDENLISKTLDIIKNLFQK